MSETNFKGQAIVYRVIADYDIVYPDPIAVRAGDYLSIGEEDTEYPGWVWCRNKAGKGGWIPLDCVEREGQKGKARYDYEATELSAKVGEEVLVSREQNSWAWSTNSRGQSGWLPVANLKRVD